MTDRIPEWVLFLLQVTKNSTSMQTSLTRRPLRRSSFSLPYDIIRLMIVASLQRRTPALGYALDSQQDVADDAKLLCRLRLVSRAWNARRPLSSPPRSPQLILVCSFALPQTVATDQLFCNFLLGDKLSGEPNHISNGLDLTKAFDHLASRWDFPLQVKRLYDIRPSGSRAPSIKLFRTLAGFSNLQHLTLVDASCSRPSLKVLVVPVPALKIRLRSLSFVNSPAEFFKTRFAREHQRDTLCVLYKIVDLSDLQALSLYGPDEMATWTLGWIYQQSDAPLALRKLELRTGSARPIYTMPQHLQRKLSSSVERLAFSLFVSTSSPDDPIGVEAFRAGIPPPSTIDLSLWTRLKTLVLRDNVAALDRQSQSESPRTFLRGGDFPPSLECVYVHSRYIAYFAGPSFRSEWRVDTKHHILGALQTSLGRVRSLLARVPSIQVGFYALEPQGERTMVDGLQSAPKALLRNFRRDVREANKQGMAVLDNFGGVWDPDWKGFDR